MMDNRPPLAIRLITSGKATFAASDRAVRHPAMRFSAGVTVAAAAFMTPATVM
jgi:hypothetical protein